MFVPSSKPPEDPDYNDNFEAVCKHVKEMLGSKIIIEQPFEIIQTRTPSSLTGGRRDRQYVEQLKSNLKRLDFTQKPAALIIFDDVITTGAHFIAVKELLIENLPQAPTITGLFWALSKKLPSNLGRQSDNF